MGPPGARLGHPNSGAAPDLTHRRKDDVLAVRGSDDPRLVRVAAISSSGRPLRARSSTRSRISVLVCKLEDGVDFHFDFEIGHSAAPPDDPDLSDIVLTAVEHNFVNKTPQ